MEGGDSEFANFTLPTSKTFLEARSQNVTEDAPKRHVFFFFFGLLLLFFVVVVVVVFSVHELAISWSAKKRRKDTFFSTLHPLSPVIFATVTVVAFALLRSYRFNLRSYTQREATPT